MIRARRLAPLALVSLLALTGLTVLPLGRAQDTKAGDKADDKAGDKADDSKGGAAPKVHVTRLGKACKLQRAKFNEDDKMLKLEFGEVVKATAKLRIDTFFKKTIINAGITIKNTGKVPMFTHYYIAFLDKDGKLVGCVAQGSFGNDGMKPGASTQLGSCLIPLPHDAFDKVARYELVYYESTAPIGQG